MSNWLFQGNPKRYPVLDHLLDGEMEVDWSVTRHLDEISGGDNAALWVSGKRAGVYATGYVMDSPYIGRADDEWIEPADRGKELNFCPIQWTENRVDRPILKGDLLAAGGFEQARIIRQPWAGNPMKLTNAEWRVIERLG